MSTTFTQLLHAEIASVLSGEPVPATDGAAHDVVRARSLAIELVASWKSVTKRSGRAGVRTGAYTAAAGVALGIATLSFQSVLQPPLAYGAAALALCVAGGLLVVRNAAKLRRTSPNADEIIAGYESGDAARAERTR